MFGLGKINQAPDKGGPDKIVLNIKNGGQGRVVEATSTSPGNSAQRDNS